MDCRKVKKELTAYVSGELSRSSHQGIEAHLQSCSSCQRELASIEATREMLKSWGNMEPSAGLFSKFEARLSKETLGKGARGPAAVSFRWLSHKWVYALVAAVCLTVIIGFHLFLLPDETPLETRQRSIPYQEPGGVQIGFYIAEHESALKQASFQRASISPGAPFWIPLRRENLLYYDTISGGSEEAQGSSGLILKSKNGWGKETSGEEKTESRAGISDGEVLRLAEAREAVSFDIVAPATLCEAYRLISVRKIPDKEYVQLVYSSGRNTISLFEQPITGGERLNREDFREYILRLTKNNERIAVLGWHTEQAVFNLVGEMSLPDLMKVADEIQERYITDGMKQYYQKLYDEGISH